MGIFVSAFHSVWEWTSSSVKHLIHLNQTTEKSNWEKIKTHRKYTENGYFCKCISFLYKLFGNTKHFQSFKHVKSFSSHLQSNEGQLVKIIATAVDAKFQTINIWALGLSNSSVFFLNIKNRFVMRLRTFIYCDKICLKKLWQINPESWIIDNLKRLSNSF